MVAANNDGDATEPSAVAQIQVAALLSSYALTGDLARGFKFNLDCPLSLIRETHFQASGRGFTIHDSPSFLLPQSNTSSPAILLERPSPLS